jgi:hypothetical protein
MHDICFNCKEPLVADEASVGVLLSCSCGEGYRPGKPRAHRFTTRPAVQTLPKVTHASSPEAASPPSEPASQGFLQRVATSDKWYYRCIRTVAHELAKPTLQAAGMVILGLVLAATLKLMAYFGY